MRFKKREKHPWKSITFSEDTKVTKINTPPWMFFTFFKSHNGKLGLHCAK